VTFGLSVTLLSHSNFGFPTAYPAPKKFSTPTFISCEDEIGIFYLFLVVFTRVFRWLFTNPVSAMFFIIVIRS